MFDLKELTPDEMDRLCIEELGQKPGQGHRVAVQLFRKRVEDFDAMTDLNKPLRELLKRQCTISRLVVERSESSDDGTTKLLYRLRDGNSIEGVLIPGPGRLTLC